MIARLPAATHEFTLWQSRAPYGSSPGQSRHRIRSRTQSIRDHRWVDVTELATTWRSGMERLVTMKRAAEILSVSPEFLKKLERAGRLRVVRLGRAVRIPQQELERL